MFIFGSLAKKFAVHCPKLNVGTIHFPLKDCPLNIQFHI